MSCKRLRTPALEEQQELLRRRKEELDLDMELAASMAKVSVFKASEGSCVSNVSVKSDGMNSYLERGKRTQLRYDAATFVPEFNTQPLAAEAGDEALLSGYAAVIGVGMPTLPEAKQKSSTQANGGLEMAREGAVVSVQSSGLTGPGKQDCTLSILPVQIYADVDHLIGTNVPKTLEPWEVISAVNGGPYAIKTILGWTMNGPLRGDCQISDQCLQPNITINRISVARLDELWEKQLKVDLPETVQDEQPGLSKEDKRFIESVLDSAKLIDGHYSISLPGTSLNSQPLQGPDLTNLLVGVLTRFRKEPVVLMADIEAMFHQLHHFADASEEWFGTVTYLLLHNDSGRTHSAFVMGKARVAPLKLVTIPRMELNTAVVASRMDKLWRKELQMDLQESVF
ncbi:hypothetical protein PO909_027771 [Leuciscus waleckii]